jgi:hypothetical protein
MADEDDVRRLALALLPVEIPGGVDSAPANRPCLRTRFAPVTVVDLRATAKPAGCSIDGSGTHPLGSIDIAGSRRLRAEGVYVLRTNDGERVITQAEAG